MAARSMAARSGWTKAGCPSLLALRVVEVGTDGSHVVAIEADRLEHANHLGVEVALMEIEVLPRALTKL